MTIRQPRYSKDEHARRGSDLYEQRVAAQVEAGNRGRIVALDVDSAAFEVADDTLTASQRLLRCPDARSGAYASAIWQSIDSAASADGADMITGIVNVDLEAVLRFSVGDAAGHSHDVEAVIDTGFNGFLTLPPALVAALRCRGSAVSRGNWRTAVSRRLTSMWRR